MVNERFTCEHKELLLIYQDINSRYSVGIHRRIFILAEEPVEEPPNRLLSLLEKAGIPEEEFFVMEHGQTKELDILKRTN